MKYYLDTEFNGFKGKLISMALVCEDGRELYFRAPYEPCVEWVEQNVVPIISCEGAHPIMLHDDVHGIAIQSLLGDDPDPVIISDWPDDIRYFCEALIVGPGMMVNTAQKLAFEIRRVDAYPTTLPGAIQHNALWDARALKRALES